MNKEILKLALPNILSNISLPLLSSVDTALMGGLSTAHIAAVGIASIIFNFMYWNFGFLRMGTTGIISQYFGAQDHGNISEGFGRVCFVAFTFGIILWILQPFLQSGAISIMQVQESNIPLVKTYFDIRIWDAPATLLLFCLFGWLFGMQNAWIPMVITIFINCVNIGLSWYFVQIQEYGIRGVAYGTVIAQYLGLMLCVVAIVLRYKSYVLNRNVLNIFNKQRFKAFFRLNGDISLRTLMLTGSIAFFFAQSSHFGVKVLAINVILFQFVNWMSYGIDGFAYAAESLVGKYKGAQDFISLQKVIKRLFLWGGGLCLFFTGLYFAFAEELFYLFSKDDALWVMAKSFIFWIMLFPILSFASYIWDGIFIGLTASRAMRDTMFFSFLGFVMIFYISKGFLDEHAIWLAMIMMAMLRGVFQTIWYNRYLKFDLAK